jgi:CHAT domain-containing protein/Tfp pilus assembly protein PilF
MSDARAPVPAQGNDHALEPQVATREKGLLEHFERASVMSAYILRTMVALLFAGVPQALAEAPSPEKPAWERLLQGADQKKATELDGRVDQLQEAGKWAEAVRAAEELLELRQKVQGKDHWEAVNARWQVQALRAAQRQNKEVQKEYAGVVALDREAVALEARGSFREAQPLRQKALEIRLKVLGEDHPDTATSYNWVAFDLNAQGKYAAAEEGFRKALALRRKMLGEEHPDTADSYNNLAANLHAQGKSREAEDGFRKALAIRLEVLGAEHPDTAQSYNNRAHQLMSQGKYREAEGDFRKALAIQRKVLGAEHPDTATGCNNLAFTLNAQGKYADAAEFYRQALAIRRKVLGEGHPDTAQSYSNLAANLDAQGKYPEGAEFARKALAIRLELFGAEHPETANSYNNLAGNLNAQGKYKEAEESYRKALAIKRKLLGEEHPDTATGYNNLAFNLHAQGMYAAAEDGFRKALAIRRQLLGEEHRETAISYNNLAGNLQEQGKSHEAAEGYRKALVIHRKVLGEEHPATAHSYNEMAVNLKAQGKYAAATEGFHKALSIRRKMLGEEHPETARSYHNVATNLDAQGRYKEAEEGYRKALAIRRKVFGEQHPDTAFSYESVAANLNAQGKYAEAAEGFRKALDIRLEVLGAQHPLTATSSNWLAFNLYAQGKYAEAADGFRKALAIRLEVLGEEHPDTAQSYNNVAANLNAQGKYKEAEEGLRKSLEIRRKVFGEEHSCTASSYTNVAINLTAQGKYREAEEYLVRGAEAFLAARLHFAVSGLERATRTDEDSPLPRLAAVLARNGKPAEAWQRYEQGLGRGLWDDLSARRIRQPEEYARQTQLLARLQRLDQLLLQTVAVARPIAEQQERRQELLTQRLQAQQAWSDFHRQLEAKYGPVAGKILPQEKIQAGLPPDTALIGWIDFPPAGPKAADPNGEHWAVVLRARGDPTFEPLRGSGAVGDWTKEDDALAERLRAALQSSQGDWRDLAQRLRDQRLKPLRRHLRATEKFPAVRRLVVLPSTALRGLPLEALSDEYTISYASSGTLYAHLRQQPAVESTGLLAVGDPVFEAAPAADKEKPLPPGGVLLTVVQPGSNAAQSGLRSDDVLLRYGDSELKTPADLKAALAAADAKSEMAVRVWRDGATVRRHVRPGPLGVVLASKPASQALGERYRLDRVLATRSGDDRWKALPGTRVEVAALRRLFGDKPEPRLLFDAEASEQKLDDLAASGELARYRYIHLATHGEVDDAWPMRSALILSRDALPDPQQQLLAGKPVYDGRLTAEEMLRTWNLQSELVTLSACQTALGKYERGEGFVGFAQALLLCGSRSVCLSLWKVDDAATALLMKRFYANLLGKRAGLAAPLPKAAALREAKEWLRNLSRSEALRLAAEVSQGVERGKDRPRQPLLPRLPSAAGDDRPYAHPYYWAAFILIGDAD